MDSLVFKCFLMSEMRKREKEDQVPWGRQLWLYHNLSLFPHPQWSTGCLWREPGHKQCACCWSSSRWKHLGCCAEAEQEQYVRARHYFKFLAQMYILYWTKHRYVVYFWNIAKLVPRQQGTGASAGSSVPSWVCLWLCFSSPVYGSAWPAGPCSPTGGYCVMMREHQIFQVQIRVLLLCGIHFINSSLSCSKHMNQKALSLT